MKNNPLQKQLGEYFDTFLPEIQQTSENTISAYADAFYIFFQFLSEERNLSHDRVTYKQLTVALFDDFLIWMVNNRGYSNSSVRQRMSAITAFLKYASKREMSALTAFSSAKSTDRPKVVRGEFPYFTKEEMTILLALPDPKKHLGSRDLVLLSFLYDTAARAQELCDICVGDVRFGSPTKIKIRGKDGKGSKGGKTREIPISDEVTNLLKYHIKTQNLSGRDNASHPLFSSQSNAAMTTSCVRSIVEKYVKLAKLKYPEMFLEKGYSPHSFRHSKAVHMAEAGVNILYIRNFLGHETIESTEIYARVGQEAVMKALTNRQIPRLAGNPPKTNEEKKIVPECITRTRTRKIM